MKRIISLIALCAFVMCTASCESADRLISLVKNNIEDISENVTGAAEDEEKTEVENSIAVCMEESDMLNPISADKETVREVMELVFDPLFELDSQMHITPVLASGYSMSADGLLYDIKIKQDVKWHDGKTLDAYDAAYSVNAAKTSAAYAERLSEVTDCRAVNNDTLRISLSRPVPQFVSLLSFPLVKYGADMTNAYKPVGTGAFTFDGKVGTDKYRLSAFGLYHNGRAKLDNVYIQTVPDLEKYRSLFDVSETDIVSGRIINLTTYMPKGKSRFTDYIGNTAVYAGFNMKSKQLTDAQTRIGIAAAINRESIVSNALYSRAQASDTMINPSSWLYGGGNELKSSREKAMEHLGNAGWGLDSSGYMVRRGKEKLSVVLLADSENEMLLTAAKMIKSDLEKCGIRVTLDEQKNAAYLQKISRHDFDMFVGEYDSGINQDLEKLIKNGENSFSYDSSEAELLISQMGMTTDENAIREIAQQLGKKLAEDMPFVPICYKKESVLCSNKLKSGVSPSVSGCYRVSNMWSVKE